MSSAESTATFGRHGGPAAVKSLILVLFFGPVALFLGDGVASALGTSLQVGQVVGTVVPTALVALLGYRFGGSGTVSFQPDALAFRDRPVRYDDVAVAVRTGGFSNRLFGTATFELLVPGGTSQTLRYVRQPDEVGRLLAANVPTPADQLDLAPGAATDAADGDGPEYIESGWQFWSYWRADESLPETALVGLDDLKRVLDVSAVDVERIDGLDMRDASGLGDVEKEDVTSSSHSNPAP